MSRGATSRRVGRAGMTLVELMVGIALATILISVASGIFLQSRRIYDRSLGEIATANEIRSGMERIKRDLRDIRPPLTAGWELRITDANGAEGEEDSLQYVTYESSTSPVVVRVRVRLGARDEDGLATLSREATERWNGSAFEPIVPTPPGMTIMTKVRTFRVEFAWASNTYGADPTLNASEAHGFMRGAPDGGPTAATPTATGNRFVYTGTNGSIATATDSRRVLSMAGTPWHATLAMPRRLAHTVIVTAPAAARGAYPIVDVIGATQLTLLGAPDATNVSYVIPILPPAIQITVRHESANGPRTVTEIMNLYP